MEEKAFGLRIFVIIWVTSSMERRKKGKNNWKEYYSISRAKKVRLKIRASYCNIFKVF